MENFRIIKETYDNSAVNKFWEIFELDSFNFQTGMQNTLQVEQVYALVDRFEFMEDIPQIEMISELTHHMFNNFGGTSKTPTRDVLAFSYLLFVSPNLRMVEMFDSIAQGTHFNTTLRFLHENDREVPTQYLHAAQQMIKDGPIYDMIIHRYPIKLTKMMSDTEFVEWMAQATIDIADYIKGVNATRSIQDLI